MEKYKIWTFSTLKPFDQLLQNLTWVSKSWTLRMPNFIALPSVVYDPHTRDFPYQMLPSAVTFYRFFWLLQLATAYTPKRNFTKNTPKNVASAKDVPFRGPDDHR